MDTGILVDSLRPVARPDDGELCLIPLDPSALSEAPAGSHPLIENLVDGVRVGQPVRVFLRREGGFVHQPADGEVRQRQPVELLANQIGLKPCPDTLR